MLVGGASNDSLVGGAEGDTFFGGPDADMFQIAGGALPESNGVQRMNIRERKETLELASHLRQTAKGKLAHAQNLRGAAAQLRFQAKELPRPDFAPPPGGFLEWFDDHLGAGSGREKRARMEAEAESSEAEAEKAEAAAAAAYAEADRLTERAIRGS